MIVTVFGREYVVTPDEIRRAFALLEVSSEAGRLHDMVSSLVSAPVPGMFPLAKPAR